MLISRRFSTYRCVLGIETSCDDTAVAIVNSDRLVLASERFTNRDVQTKFGGIVPSVCAEQHKEHLPTLIEKCLKSSSLEPKDLSAIAVTTTPGLVIALKEGISTAISLAKANNLPLIPIHHMRAHSLAIFLSERQKIKFPFANFLISGGHALISRANTVEDFQLFGKSVSGSPGECIDKVAREISDFFDNELKNMHAGAAVEIMAERSSPEGYLQYTSVLPSTSGADMNFSQLKSTYLNLARKHRTADNFNVENFCASLQHSVTRHICSKLHAFLEFSTEELDENCSQLVIGGGVASNRYIFNGIKKVANAYNYEVLKIPPNYCTDNAEMIAMTGILMMEERSPSIISSAQIPDSIYAHARTEIGIDERWKLPSKPAKRLATTSIHGDLPLKFHNVNKKL